MAIEPYRRQIGLPNTAGGGMTRIADTRSVDIGPAISGLGDALRKTFEPILADEALQRGKEEAAKVQFTRNSDGQLVLPPKNEDGGLIFTKAFDEVVEARYITEIGSDFQSFLDTEAAQRRTGEKPFDPADYAATVDAKKVGMLEAVDPRIRPQLEELFEREALERTRAFTNEWSSTKRRETIAGINDLVRFHMNGLKDWRINNLSQEQAIERHAKPLQELVGRLRNLQMAGPEEADAILMQTDQLTDGIESYTRSIEEVAPIISAIGGMDASSIQLVRMWTDGINYEGQVSGLVSVGVGAPEKVTPETLDAFVRERFGIKPNSGPRDPSHPLSIANPGSYHNTKNGGRAVDTPAIKGMTFEEYVQSWKDAGFTVVEAIDEYKTPSKNATGGHWHVALGNTRKVTAQHEIPDLKDLSFDRIQKLDPSVRALLKNYLTDREQVLRAEAAEAREIARQEAQTKRLEDAMRETGEIIEGMGVNGLAGGYSAKQKLYLENEYKSIVDVSKLGTSEQQALTLGFMQKRNHVPEDVIRFLDNTIRSDNWQQAVQLYQNIGTATMGPNNARIGDMLLSELDPKTAALLQYSDELSRLGLTRPQIYASIDARRSGRGFTETEAKAEFNLLSNGDKNRTYDKVKREVLTEAMGVKQGYSLPAQLQRDFDAAFTANLEITGQPEKAMKMAVNQVKGRYTASGLFEGRIGPASLLNNYKRETIEKFFLEGKTADGKLLVPRPQGQRRTIFGPNPSIRLVPLDSNTKGVGLYRVNVYEPNNTANLIHVFDVDLGAELNQFVREQDLLVKAKTRPEKLQEARARRDGEAQKQREWNARSDRIGGKM